MKEVWMDFVLSNFSLVMFAVAAFFMLINRLVVGVRLTPYEIVYRWLAIFVLGFGSLYKFAMHAFYPAETAFRLGMLSSPFQYQVALAYFAFGVLGVFSFNASYGFRLATVIAATIWMWGQACSNLLQMVLSQQYTLDNVGPCMWMNVLLPVLLIACVNRLKPKR